MVRFTPPPVPMFLTLAGHPVRWQLLAALANSDLRVQELTDAVGLPQNLVSYHLHRLREGGLVSSHRSSFDRRAAYYRIHLDRCGALLAATGAALHPGLSTSGAPAPTARPVPTGGRRATVLFLCTGNGTRSQLAEALLRELGGDRCEVASAGSHPKPVHPNAVRVLAEQGIDISEAVSKPLAALEGRHFDLVITLCDSVREICPEFPGRPRAAHWSIEDPSRLPGGDRATMPAFRDVAADLRSRVLHLLATIDTDLSDPSDTSKEHTHHGR